MEPRVAELLVRGGVVSRDQLNQAQEKGRNNGSTVMKELVQLGFTTEEELAQFLGRQFGIEKIDLDPGLIDDTVFAVVPPQVVQKHQVVPTKLIGSILTVAMADPTDLVAINEIKFITGYGVKVVLASPSTIKKVLDHRFGGISYDDVLKKFGDSDMEVILEQDDVNLQELQQATMEAPVVTLVNAILADAAKRRVAAIFISNLTKRFFESDFASTACFRRS
jgi:type IV pilus assembly protein PilB